MARRRRPTCREAQMESSGHRERDYGALATEEPMPLRDDQLEMQT